MLLRLLGTSALVLLLQASFPANTAQTLRDRYGAPVSENFLVRPGVVATTTYGASGHVCQIVLSPERLWNSTLNFLNVGDLIDEVVPKAERGKRVMAGFADAICFPTMDCGGSDEVWENVYIFHNGSTGSEHYVRITWRRGECQPTGK
jgi:hypothetical protein